MIKVHIYYSLRKDEEGLPTLKLFAEEECARADQDIFKFWQKPCFGHIMWEVSGVAHMDSVTTREEYIKELKSLPNVSASVVENLK